MPEASGVILLKAPDHLLKQFDPDSTKIDRKLIAQLFDAAKVKESVKDTVLDGARRKKRFAHEGIESRDGFVQISPFGDEWLHPLQALIKFGADVEIYGSISHEYGYSEYYALNDKGERFFETIRFEGGFDPVEAKQVVLDWLACVPAAIQEKFPAAFASEDLLNADVDTGEANAESGPRWTPVADTDFVMEIDGVIRLHGDLLNPENYQREHLAKAKALGAGLLSAYEDGGMPYSQLHRVITSLELNVRQKSAIAIDMVDLFEIELDRVCKGYGESYGTALYLAAKKGLPDVVKKLLEKGADAGLGGEWCPLEVAQSQLDFMILLGQKTEDLDLSTRNDGVREDYEEIVAYLEALRDG